MLITRDRDQILSAALARLVAETDITHTSPGGVARTWFEIAAEELGYDFRLMDSNVSQLFVTSAGGLALERFGSIFGITRSKTYSMINANEGRVYFYLNSSENHEPGTSDMSAAQSITIPSGTLLSTLTIDVGTNPITWKTTADCTIESGSYMAYASVAPVTRVVNSVASGTLLYHNLDTVAFEDVYVYNRQDLETSEITETDGNLRYRITEAIHSLARANVYALRLAALGVDGIRDCSIIPLSKGVGTVSAVVTLDEPNGTNAATIFSNAYGAMSDVLSAGDVLDVTTPTARRVALTATVTGDVDATIRANIAAAISRYIATLGVGDPISAAKITNEALSISPKIQDFAIIDGGFVIDGTPMVFTKIQASDDEQFYTMSGDIVILATN